MCVFTAQGLDTFGLMFYNNILSLPIVILICCINGDFVGMSSYVYVGCLRPSTVLSASRGWTGAGAGAEEPIMLGLDEC